MMHALGAIRMVPVPVPPMFADCALPLLLSCLSQLPAPNVLKAGQWTGRSKPRRLCIIETLEG